MESPQIILNIQKIRIIIINKRFNKIYNNDNSNIGIGLYKEKRKVYNGTKFISELNIGHFIVSEALFIGLDKAVKKFKKIIKP